MKTIKRIAAFALAGSMLALPLAAQQTARGKADFTRYVALGDSFGAGYSNDSLVISHQVHSYPAVIARQARTPDFQQPLISEPGIPPELQLVSLSPLIIARKATTNGQPINLQLPRPYNNLSIPGARVGNLLRNSGVPTDPNPFYQIILRRQGPAVEQALALQPTFISIWIGGNDVLGAILGGDPSLLTPLEQFTEDYNQLLTVLAAGAPNAGMVVGNVPPTILALPYATTIPPVVINPATRQPVLIGGNPVFLLYDDNGTMKQLTPGSLVLLPAASAIASGFGIPAALGTNLPNAGRPLPGSLVLTPDELAQIRTRAAEINAAISAAAASKNIPVVDMAPLIERFTQPGGYNLAGVRLSFAYLTGGIISYDGFHPTDIGYTLIANEFIRTINRAYKKRIPFASLANFYENNAPLEASVVDPELAASVTFPPTTWDNLFSTFVSQTPAISIPDPVTGVVDGE